MFVDDLVNGAHDFSTNTFNVMLTNNAPAASNHVLSDITEIAAGNGYTAGGTTSAVTATNSGGTETITGANVVFTAAGGTIGPFRYAVLYNETASLLIGYWDYGSAVTLQAGETFTVAPVGNNFFTLS